MKILYLGNNVRGSVCLRSLIDNGYEITAAVGHPKSTSLWGETVKDICDSEGIEFFQPENINSDQFVSTLKSIDFDYAVLAGYGKILRSKVLDIAPSKFINLHGGLVPQYRGSSITRWVFMNGESKAGISILRVSNGIDTGTILGQKSFELQKTDYVIDIIKKQLSLFPGLMLEVLDGLRRGSLSGREQNLEEGCYWHVLKNEDGKIDWSRMTAEQVVNHVRAFSFPYDGAFSYLDNEKISFIKAQECKELFKGLPGRICAIRNNGVVVIAKDCGLLIQSVKRGNEEVPAKEILKIGNNLL